jgi:hypothetical protein
LSRAGCRQQRIAVQINRYGYRDLPQRNAVRVSDKAQIIAENSRRW